MLIVISINDSDVWLGNYPDLMLDAGWTTGNIKGIKQPRISALH